MAEGNVLSDSQLDSDSQSSLPWTPAGQGKPGDVRSKAVTIKSDDNGDYIEVDCGSKKGRLYLEKMNSKKGHSTEKSIRCEGKMYTPAEFEILGGKGKAKSWKKSIKHGSKTLFVLMEKGLISSEAPSSQGFVSIAGTPTRNVQPEDMQEVFKNIEQSIMQAIMSSVEMTVRQACDQLKQLLLNEVAKLRESVQKLENEVRELKKADNEKERIFQESQQQEIGSKFTVLATSAASSLTQKVQALSTAVDHQQKICELQERERRKNNLVIIGVEEQDSEDELKVVNELLETKLEISDVNLAAARRLGQKITGRNRPILVRFTNPDDKTKVINNKQKLKGTSIYINLDRTRSQREHDQRLRNERKQAISQGKKARIVRGRLVVEERQRSDRTPQTTQDSGSQD